MQYSPPFYPIARKAALFINCNLPVTCSHVIICILLLCNSSACKQTPYTEKPAITTSGNNNFNIKQYFESEIARLSNSKTALQKTATLNTQSETKTLQEVNWQKELALFTASDMNKPAWKDKYIADTTRQNELVTVSYTATDATLRTQLVKLVFKNNSTQPVSVNISNQANNFVYQLSENLSYQPATGYNIQSTQKVILMQPETFALTAGFVNN